MKGDSSGKRQKKNPDKPKVPKRGMGVAALEKIRLQEEMSSNHHLPPTHNPYANLSPESVGLENADWAYMPYSFPDQPFVPIGLPPKAKIKYNVAEQTDTFPADLAPPPGFPPKAITVSGPSDIGRANLSIENSQLYQRGSFPQQFPQPTMTRTLNENRIEDSEERRSESSGQNSVDLELKLSVKSP